MLFVSRPKISKIISVFWLYLLEMFNFLGKKVPFNGRVATDHVPALSKVLITAMTKCSACSLLRISKKRVWA